MYEQRASSQWGLVYISWYTRWGWEGLPKLSLASSPGSMNVCLGVWVTSFESHGASTAKMMSWPSGVSTSTLAEHGGIFYGQDYAPRHAERSCWFTSWQSKCLTFEAANGILATLETLLSCLNSQKHTMGIGLTFAVLIIFLAVSWRWL